MYVCDARLYPSPRCCSGADLVPESEPYHSSLYRQAALSDDVIVRPRPDSRRVLAAKRLAVANRTGDIYPVAGESMGGGGALLRRAAELTVPLFWCASLPAVAGVQFSSG